jgi:hypothetical protein
VSDVDLQQALRALGCRLEAEPGPDLAAGVLARIAAPAPVRPPARRRRLPAPGRLRTVLVAAALLLLAAAVAFAASRTVRGWLLGHGADVRRTATLPPATTARDVPALGLGTPVTPAAAARALGRPLPASPQLGPPAAVLLARTAAGPAVTLVWPPSRTLPAAPAVPAVGALLTIGPEGTGDDAIFVAKSLTRSTSAEFVTIPQVGDGVFIGGAPHAVRLFDGRSIGFRLAANVLLYAAGTRLVRLEGAFTRDTAIALATSIR